MRKLAHLLTWLSGLLIGALILPYLLAGEIYEYQDTMDGARLPDIDVIVCLAGGRGRIAAAGDLWYRYWEASQRDSRKVPVLYISGMGPQANSAVLKRNLRAGVRNVIRAEDVVIENESVNTEANALWLARYIQKQQIEPAITFVGGGAPLLPLQPKPSLPSRAWKRMVLITSPYHMKRAQMIFDRIFHALGVSVQIDTLSAFQEPFEPGEWRTSFNGTHVTVLEYLKWVYYRIFWKPLSN